MGQPSPHLCFKLFVPAKSPTRDYDIFEMKTSFCVSANTIGAAKHFSLVKKATCSLLSESTVANCYLNLSKAYPNGT